LKVIDDLWILTEDGTVLFSKVLNERIKEQMFGALMSAINIFSQKLTAEGLKHIKLNNMQFVLIRSKKLLFIANSSTTGKSQKVNHELIKVIGKFFKRYSSVLEQWDGDITVFSDFIEDLDGIKS
jgi:hypothetical protein